MRAGPSPKFPSGMQALHESLSAFGPFVILAGAAVEGQTAVIAGGVVARNGLMSPWTALAAAAVGSALIDYLLFMLGRGARHTRFVKRVSDRPGFAKALSLIERYPVGFILGFRFLYGLRAAGPVAVGMTTIAMGWFAVLNALGAALWAGVFVAIGYAFGPTVMRIVGAAMAHLAPLALGAAGIAVVAGLVYWRWRSTATTDAAAAD